MTCDERVLDAWCDALFECWHLAYGARANEIKGHRVKSFDDRGMHPYSAAWGRVLGLESLLPELTVMRVVSPMTITSMRREAAQEATADLAAEIQRKGIEVFK